LAVVLGVWVGWSADSQPAKHVLDRDTYRNP